MRNKFGVEHTRIRNMEIEKSVSRLIEYLKYS